MKKSLLSLTEEPLAIQLQGKKKGHSEENHGARVYGYSRMLMKHFTLTQKHE
jgi:hypothetical protein